MAKIGVKQSQGNKTDVLSKVPNRMLGIAEDTRELVGRTETGDLVEIPTKEHISNVANNFAQSVGVSWSGSSTNVKDALEELRTDIGSSVSSGSAFYVRTPAEFRAALKNVEIGHIIIGTEYLVMDNAGPFELVSRTGAANQQLLISGGRISWPAATYQFIGSGSVPIVVDTVMYLDHGTVFNSSMDLPQAFFINDLEIGTNGASTGTVTMSADAGKYGVGLIYTNRTDFLRNLGIGNTITGNAAGLSSWSGFFLHYQGDAEIDVWCDADLKKALQDDRVSKINVNYDNPAITWVTGSDPLRHENVVVASRKTIQGQATLALNAYSSRICPLRMDVGGSLEILLPNVLINTAVHFDVFSSGGSWDDAFVYFDHISLNNGGAVGLVENVGEVSFKYGKLSSFIGGNPQCNLKLTKSGDVYNVHENNMHRYDLSRRCLSNKISNLFELAQALYITNPGVWTYTQQTTVAGNTSFNNCRSGYGLEEGSMVFELDQDVTWNMGTGYNSLSVGGRFRKFTGKSINVYNSAYVPKQSISEPAFAEFVLLGDGYWSGAADEGILFDNEISLGNFCKLTASNLYVCNIRKPIRVGSTFYAAGQPFGEEQIKCSIVYETTASENAGKYKLIHNGYYSNNNPMDVAYPQMTHVNRVLNEGNLSYRIIDGYSEGGLHRALYAGRGTGVTTWAGLSKLANLVVRVTDGTGYIQQDGELGSKQVSWAGTGKFDSMAGDGDPTTVYWTYYGYQDITVSFGSSKVVVLYVDEFGAVQQKQGYLTNAEKRKYIRLATLTSADGGVSITGITGNVSVVDNAGSMLEEMLAVTSNPKSGFNVIGSQSNLSLSVGDGKLFWPGINYQSDPTNPHTYSFAGASPITMIEATRSSLVQIGSGSVEVANYDNAGTVTAIPNNNFVNHRLYFVPETNGFSGFFVLQYGQVATYNTLEAAAAAANTEAYTPNPDLSRSVLLAVVTVKQGSTNLTSANCKIAPTDTFGGYNSGTGAGSSGSTLDLSIAVVTGPSELATALASATVKEIYLAAGTPGNFSMSGTTAIGCDKVVYANGTNGILVSNATWTLTGTSTVKVIGLVTLTASSVATGITTSCPLYIERLARNPTATYKVGIKGTASAIQWEKTIDNGTSNYDNATVATQNYFQNTFVPAASTDLVQYVQNYNAIQGGKSTTPSGSFLYAWSDVLVAGITGNKFSVRSVTGSGGNIVVYVGKVTGRASGNFDFTVLGKGTLSASFTGQATVTLSNSVTLLAGDEIVLATKINNAGAGDLYTIVPSTDVTNGADLIAGTNTSGTDPAVGVQIRVYAGTMAMLPWMRFSR